MTVLSTAAIEASAFFLAVLLRFLPIVYRTIMGRPAPPKKHAMMLRMDARLPDGMRTWHRFALCYAGLALVTTLIIFFMWAARQPSGATPEPLPWSLFQGISIFMGVILALVCRKLGRFLEAIEV